MWERWQHLETGCTRSRFESRGEGNRRLRARACAGEGWGGAAQAGPRARAREDAGAGEGAGERGSKRALGIYKFSANSSGSTFASFRTFFNVPGLSSSCIGTTVPILPCVVTFESLTWLPDCPEIMNPKRLHRTLITISPEMPLSFGNFDYLKGGYKRSLLALQGELFQIKLSSLL